MKLHEEFKLIENLWDNILLEWKYADGSSATTHANQTTKNSSNTSDVVYAWDMYLDPRDKGSFCSAEKYHGVWDGMVFETESDAETAGWYHLLELENEGELYYDSNVYVEPNDFIIDVFAIPLIEVPESVLKYSNLDHLI